MIVLMNSRIPVYTGIIMPTAMAEDYTLCVVSRGGRVSSDVLSIILVRGSSTDKQVDEQISARKIDSWDNLSSLSLK